MSQWFYKLMLSNESNLLDCLFQYYQIGRNLINNNNNIINRAYNICNLNDVNNLIQLFNGNAVVQDQLYPLFFIQNSHKYKWLCIYLQQSHIWPLFDAFAHIDNSAQLMHIFDKCVNNNLNKSMLFCYGMNFKCTPLTN